MNGAILKADTAKRRVYGIAMVSGVVDAQGDVIDDDEMEEMAVRSLRAGVSAQLDHAKQDAGVLIASLPLTLQLAQALGVTPPNGVGCWVVGLEFDEASWPRVVAALERGCGLSIAGRAERATL